MDPLVHLCHIANIHGNGYRMRQHAQLYSVLHRNGDRADAPGGRHDLELALPDQACDCTR